MKYLAVMGVRLLPSIISRPRLVWLALRGVHPGEYIKLDTDWIRAAQIRTILDIGGNTGQFARRQL